VPLGLRQNALPRIDQDHRKFGIRGAGRHVARVLFMPRGVGDDKSTRSRGEKPVGDINGYPLLALVLEPVQQKREVDAVTGCAKPPRVALQGRAFVVEEQPAIMEQPPDQCGFAIIDRSASQEAEEILVLLSEKSAAGTRHQK